MSRDFSNASTGVFWDVEDCPMPDDYDAISVHQMTKSAITNKGFRNFGMVDIRVFGEKNKVRDEFLLAGITVVPAGDKCARVRRMILDILFWALDNPSEYHTPQNVMVISKNISEDKELLSVLQILEWRRYNILLTDSDNVESLKELPFVSSVWLWKSLLDGGCPIGQSSGGQSSHRVANQPKRKRVEKLSTPTCSGGSQGIATMLVPKKSKSSQGDCGADTPQGHD